MGYFRAVYGSDDFCTLSREMFASYRAWVSNYLKIAILTSKYHFFDLKNATFVDLLIVLTWLLYFFSVAVSVETFNPPAIDILKSYFKLFYKVYIHFAAFRPNSYCA